LPPRFAGARCRLAGQRSRLDPARGRRHGHVPAYRARGIDRGVRAAFEALRMGIEIERKFLVAGDGWRAVAHKVVPMAQGYLNDIAMVDSGAMNTSVRVRIEGDAAFLNIKSRELGASRQEFEYPLP